jgi:hypothetical protein
MKYSISTFTKEIASDMLLPVGRQAEDLKYWKYWVANKKVWESLL